MDTATTIIGVSLLLMALAPVAWASYNTRQKKSLLQKTFDQLVSGQNLTLSHREDIDGKLIGLDAASKRLVFVSKQLPAGITIVLDKTTGFEILRNKKKCQLDLQSFGTQDCSLPFFDNDGDDILRFDYFSQKADEWLALIRRSK